MFYTIYRRSGAVNHKAARLGKERQSMIGAIIGDIAGSVYEFHSIKTKEFPLFGDRQGEKCRFTDDSAMTLAAAGALLEAAEDGSDLPSCAVRWMQRIGRKYPDAGYGGTFIRWLFAENPTPYHSYGNGSAMRVSPAGWAAGSLEEALRFSDALTAVTHLCLPYIVPGGHIVNISSIAAFCPNPRMTVYSAGKA